jgi:hypothetical protein
MRDVVHVVDTAASGRGRARVLSRLRVQVVVVTVLTFVFVAPGGGPIEQLPDTLRALADGSLDRNVVLPVLALLVLEGTVYVTGRSAPRRRQMLPGARRRHHGS